MPIAHVQATCTAHRCNVETPRKHMNTMEFIADININSNINILIVIDLNLNMHIHIELILSASRIPPGPMGLSVSA
eukprot:7609197-Lingulodinium_polyedra.AAC.1